MYQNKNLGATQPEPTRLFISGEESFGLVKSLKNLEGGGVREEGAETNVVKSKQCRRFGVCEWSQYFSPSKSCQISNWEVKIPLNIANAIYY